MYVSDLGLLYWPTSTAMSDAANLNYCLDSSSQFAFCSSRFAVRRTSFPLDDMPSFHSSRQDAYQLVLVFWLQQPNRWVRCSK